MADKPHKTFEIQVWDHHLTKKLKSVWTTVPDSGDDRKMRRLAWLRAFHRAENEGWGHVFQMESYQIRILDADIQAAKKAKEKAKKDVPSDACPQCGEETEYGDYCEHCGWQKFATTWSKRMMVAKACGTAEKN